MGVLGRGLASLIPRRNKGEANEAIEHIDQMEFDQQASPVRDNPVMPKQDAPGRKVNVLEDFEQLGGIEEMPLPDKPLVTPLPFDPFAGEEVSEASAPVKRASIPVQEESEDEADAEVVEPNIAEPEPEPEIADLPEIEPVAEVEKEEVKIAPYLVKKVVEESPEIIMPSFGSGGGGGGTWDQHEQQVEHIALGDIKINPLQPRRSFDPQELEELMNSIEQHGILQPLVVHRLANGMGFELIAGERRLRAARKLGWEKVPAVVRRDVNSDQSRLVFALIENIQRQNLNPIEEALAYKQLNEEYGLTHEEIGVRVGKSRVAVTNIVRILQLPPEIQKGLTEGKITIGHAKAILMIPDQEKQIRFYQHLLDEGLTVRKSEVRARRISRTMDLKDRARHRVPGRHPLAEQYSPPLEARYGYDATVRFVEEQNKFEVVFRAHSESEVGELVARLMGTKPLAHDLDKDVIDD